VSISKLRFLFLGFVVFFCLTNESFSQEKIDVGGSIMPRFQSSNHQILLPLEKPYAHYYRVLQVSGRMRIPPTLVLRPIHLPADSVSIHPWAERAGSLTTPYNRSLLQVRGLDPVWFTSWNSSVPRGGNDGALWQGRGLNTSVSAGAAIVAGPLRLVFRPVAGYSSNVSYDLGPYKPFSSRSVTISPYSYRSIYRRELDFVQRFGDGAVSWIHPGDSYAELSLLGFRTGLSTARQWYGPAIHHPIMFSYNAPGFLHAYFGTARPLRTLVGKAQFQYLFGGLRESGYYDDNPSNNLKAVSSFKFDYQPNWIPSLTVGLSRTYVEGYPSGRAELFAAIRKVFDPPLKKSLATEENPAGQDPDNQYIGIFGRWLFPEIGFELYGEFVRSDHNWDWRDFRMHPKHKGAYMYGFLKTVSVSDKDIWAFNYEITRLEAPRSSLTRGSELDFGDFYMHFRNGFTHEGQLLGGGVGPGSNVQIIHITRYFDERMLGLYLRRIVYHNGRLNREFERIKTFNPPDVLPRDLRNVEFMVGVEWGMSLWSQLYLNAKLEQSRIFNQHHLYGNHLWNTRLEVVLRWQLARGLR
jgi:hypothetical protein